MKKSFKSVVFAAVLALTLFTSLSPIVYVLLAALAGILIQSLRGDRS